MKRRRKTKAEQRHERDEAARKVGEYFLPKLEACQCVADAILLWHEAVPEGKPGRMYYSNLGTFLINNFAPPDGATAREVAAYIRLIEGDSNLKPDQKRKIIAMMELAEKKAIP
jgi:hypothetical protein